MLTYEQHAAVCARFYDLTLDSKNVADFVSAHSGVRRGERALFVGGMFLIARGLLEHGIDLTVTDYSEEMVTVGRAKLPGIDIQCADLRDLPFQDAFDIIFVVGRVFTHMTTPGDLELALASCRRSLRSGGRLFFDNYEDTKIQRTTYFNGVVECRDGRTSIRRVSSTMKLSEQPCVVRWDAEYSGMLDGEPFAFNDSIDHRAFSRVEIASELEKHGFSTLGQGDNFDETSFFTLAKRCG